MPAGVPDTPIGAIGSDFSKFARIP